MVTWLFGILIPLASPGPGVLLLALGNVILAAGIVAANVITASFRQTHTPPGLRGRVIATCTLLSYSADPIGAVLAGGLGSALGIRPTI